MRIALGLLVALAGCARQEARKSAEEVTGGDANRGQRLIYLYACGSCHVIPGVSEAIGTTGPPLRGIANRTYIAGLLVNSSENLSLWIREPQRVEADTAMPKLGVTEEQAADIAAYLYTLE